MRDLRALFVSITLFIEIACAGGDAESGAASEHRGDSAAASSTGDEPAAADAEAGGGSGGPTEEVQTDARNESGDTGSSTAADAPSEELSADTGDPGEQCYSRKCPGQTDRQCYYDPETVRQQLCAGQECGNEAICGIECGTCPPGASCSFGRCLSVGDLPCLRTPEIASCLGAANPVDCIKTLGCAARICGYDANNCGISCGNCAEVDGYCNGETGLCEASCMAACADPSAGQPCGPDSCGGSCGDCTEQMTCNFATGRCCQPDCTGKPCGSDGCGGSCGRCPDEQVCDLSVGQCCVAATCQADRCGFTSCGIYCPCAAGSYCKDDRCWPDEATPTCPEEFNCTDRECGPDSVCGLPCGTCAEPLTCNDRGNCDCEANCTGRTCGPDPKCQVSCGECLANKMCDDGICRCKAKCAELERECGDDGCGGSCGECAAGNTCQDGMCVCVPQCQGKVCGPNGCGAECPNLCGERAVCDPATGNCICLFNFCNSICCEVGEVCRPSDVTCCLPNVAGRECGLDPNCKTTIGDCPVGMACNGAGRCGISPRVLVDTGLETFFTTAGKSEPIPPGQPFAFQDPAYSGPWGCKPANRIEDRSPIHSPDIAAVQLVVPGPVLPAGDDNVTRSTYEASKEYCKNLYSVESGQYGELIPPSDAVWILDLRGQNGNFLDPNCFPGMRTARYQTSQPGLVLNTATGQLESGAPQYALCSFGPSTVSAVNYQVNDDGSVTDLDIGLTYQAKAVDDASWEQALAYCSTITLNGQPARLPNAKELFGVVSNFHTSPRLHHDYFAPETAGRTITSSGYPNQRGKIFVVDTSSGLLTTGAMTEGMWVRCIASTTVCIPKCADRACGSDGCGNLCEPGCGTPKLSECLNETMREYLPNGSCDNSAGACLFVSKDTLCPYGCTSGRCVEKKLGDALWQWNAGSTGDDRVRSLTSDGSGKVIVAGTFSGTVRFGADTTLTSAGGKDIFLSKLDATGAHLWTKRFGGTQDDWVGAVVVDSAGNLLVAGGFQNEINFGGGSMTSAGAYDVFLVKLDSAGNAVWSKRFGDSQTQLARSLAVDSGGNPVLSGDFYGAINFSGGNTLVSSGGLDVFIAKFDTAGGHLWSQRMGGTTTDQLFAAAVDANGNIFAGGGFQGTAVFCGSTLASMGSSDVWLLKMNSAGQCTWAKAFGATGYDQLYSIATKGTDIFATGSFGGTISFGGTPLSSVGGSSDIFLVRLNGDGGHLWSKKFGAARTDEGHFIATDAAGDVLLTGGFADAVDFGGGQLNSTAAVGSAFVAKYKSDGSHLFSRMYSGGVYDFGEAAASASDGAMLFGGWFQGAVDFGLGSTASQGGPDAYVVKLAP